MATIVAFPAHSRPSPAVAVVGEGFLRERVLNAGLPPYPEDAIRERKTGVAVAEIEVSETGRVEQVSVVESPSASIESVLALTLSTWQFKPFVRLEGGAIRVRGKLTFYYVIANAKGRVYEPKDAPYVGRWPETPSSAN